MLLIKLCKGILNRGIKAEYVLMDTWFYSDSLVASLKELSLDSICMIKKNLKFAFAGETVRHNLKNILSKDAQYNIIIGERSNGKTYACLKYGLEQYVKEGKLS